MFKGFWVLVLFIVWMNHQAGVCLLLVLRPLDVVWRAQIWSQLHAWMILLSMNINMIFITTTTCIHIHRSLYECTCVYDRTWIVNKFKKIMLVWNHIIRALNMQKKNKHGWRFAFHLPCMAGDWWPPSIDYDRKLIAAIKHDLWCMLSWIKFKDSCFQTSAA